MKSINHYATVVMRYLKIFGPIGLIYLLLAVIFKSRMIVSVRGRMTNGRNIFLRLNSSDILVFEQVFIQKEYDVVCDLAYRNGDILDVGANIGLTSIYLNQKFPEKKIIAVEPDLSNFGMLCLNVYGINNIITDNRAIWGDKVDKLFIPRNATSEWGRQTLPANFALDAQKVRAVRIEDLMECHSVKDVFLLKMDIEGAELNVFKNSPQDWIKKVNAIVIELHESVAPGCSRTFDAAIAGEFHIIAETRELKLVSR